MAAPRSRGEKPTIALDLTRCCPEAQADGVPCPTLGRSCAVCERALSVDDEAPAIRPPGRD